MPSLMSLMADEKQQAPPVTGPLDYSTNAPSILAIVGFFDAFALLVVLARIYVRGVMLKTVGTDDYVMMAAMLCGIGVLICFIGETHHGIGMHENTILMADTIAELHWNFFESLIVMVGISLVKISIAFFLLRLVTKGYRIFIVCMIVFLVAFTIACAGTLIFACIPVRANWDLTIAKTSNCYSKNIFTSIGLFNSSINIATDVIFASLPIPIVWGLQINKRTRVTLACILSLGFFCCAAAIIKTVLQASFFTTPDYTFNDSYQVWNTIELHIGIIAASLPSLRPLFAAVLESAKLAITRGTGLSSSGQRRYYMQEESNETGGIKMDSLAGENRGKYDVRVSSRSVGGLGGVGVARGGESEEDLKGTEDTSADRDSDEIFIMRNLRNGSNMGAPMGGITKTIDVSIT